MQALVRETFQNLHRHRANIPPNLHGEIEDLIEPAVTDPEYFKRIYSKKLDVVKIRIHGNYELQKILLTGKDLVIQDFSGKPAQPFSERRLKRSPMADVANMICSIHYTAYEGFLGSYQIQKEESVFLLPFAEHWAHYMSGFFVKRTWIKSRHTAFIPEENEDFRSAGSNFFTGTCAALFQYRNQESRSACVIVPLRIIQSVLKQESLSRKTKTANAALQS